VVADLFGIVLCPVDEARSPSPQHVEPDHVDAWGVFDYASVVADTTFAIDDGHVQPGVVWAVSRGPHDGADSTVDQIEAESRGGGDSRRVESLWRIADFEARGVCPIIERLQQPVHLEIGHRAHVGQRAGELGLTTSDSSQSPDDLHSAIGERVQVNRAAFWGPDQLGRREIPGSNEIIHLGVTLI
jgi:hypothetical protein